MRKNWSRPLDALSTSKDGRNGEVPDGSVDSDGSLAPSPVFWVEAQATVTSARAKEMPITLMSWEVTVFGRSSVVKKFP